MGGGWWTRFVVNVLLVLWGVWMLIPTFLGESAQERLAANAAQAAASAQGTSVAEEAEVELLWYEKLLPSARINLGLDLQGGIDMTLKVETDEASISAVQRDMKAIKDGAEEEGVPLAELRRVPGLPELLVRLGPEADQGKFEGFMKLKFSEYESAGTRDLDGQTYRVYALSASAREGIARRAVEQALQTLRNRVNATGVKEPLIVLKGGNRINIELPGMDNVEQAIAALGTTAVLEFMMVVPKEDVDEDELEKALLTAEQTLDKAVFKDDQQLSDWMIRNNKLPPNSLLLWEYENQNGVKTRMRPYVLRDEVMITGDDINDAHTAMDPVEGPNVQIEFKPHGGKVFSEVTGQNVGRFFAIVLDHEVRSAPRILGKISGGHARITMGTGDFQQAMNEATVLALVLRTGALPAPVTIGEVRQIGASMGVDLIRNGVNASLIAGGLVIVFMVLFYRVSGILADIALAANILLMLAMLAALGATLTLPGIAGIALTMGMAVDCNIVFNERIREELRLGRSSRSAVEVGFDRALWAVLDGHITTFIAGVVLYTYGSGPIKGFAVTLMIGIVTTLITGVYTSRMMMDLYARKSPAKISI